MDPIQVPAPPKSAFNKNRCVSDLLVGQLKHFQHVEHKQGIKIDPALKRDVQTEGGAAHYIAAITREIRSQGMAKMPATAAVAAVPVLVPAAKKAKAAKPGKVVGIAAGAKKRNRKKKP